MSKLRGRMEIVTPTPSSVSPDDLRFISQVTKVLLEYHIPCDIITKILSFSYKSYNLQNRYWEFQEGCGSGSDTVLLRITSSGCAEIILKRMWMGSDNKYIKCSGKYKSIYSSNGVSYGLLVIDSVVKQVIENFKAGEQNIILSPKEGEQGHLYFDFIQFDKWIHTEWGQDVPINLYAGGGCYSNEIFNAILKLNNSINYTKDEETKEITRMCEGIKLEETSETKYMKYIGSFKKYGFIHEALSHTDASHI